MARTKSPAVAKRNDLIFAEWRRGATLASLAAKHEISRQVVGRVIASYHPELEEETDRALYRGELWRLYDEMGAVFADPGYKMQPNGRVAEGPDGEPAQDVNAKIQAGELRLKVLGELRKMDGRDRPQQKQLQVTHELASSQAALDIARRKAEMEQLARRAGQPAVVRGEVVGELPAAQPEAS